MRGGREQRIEAAIDRSAAAALAGAVAYALVQLLRGMLVQPQLSVFAAASAAIAYLLSARGLRSLPAEPPSFDLPDFQLADVRESEPDELLLTDADRLQPIATPEELLLTDADRLQPLASADTDELVLDDILAELGEDSRVVQLFDPAAMPTPAQLNARIEQHLGQGASPTAPPDASQALYQALADLRRSLR